MSQFSRFELYGPNAEHGVDIADAPPSDASAVDGADVGAERGSPAFAAAPHASRGDGFPPLAEILDGNRRVAIFAAFAFGVFLGSISRK